MNLMICTSPLQILIANRIIERYYPEESFFGLFIVQTHNAKHTYYFEECLSKCCKHSLMIPDESGALLHILKRFVSCGMLRAKRVFVSSLNKAIVHRLLGCISVGSIYTYDDGAANLITTGWLNSEDAPLRSNKLRTLLGLRVYDSALIKSLSRAHYTIFGDLPNIVSHTLPITLTDSAMEEQGDDEPESINIMLGQAVYHDNARDAALTERVMTDYKVERYFPHPKEEYVVLGGVKNVNTPLIFEDYYAKELSGKHCRIYTFFSTAAINLYKQPGVEVISLKPHDIDNESYLQTYELFAKLGIPIIELPESY